MTIADGQNDDRDANGLKVLLELDASVCSDEHLEPGAHGARRSAPF